MKTERKSTEKVTPEVLQAYPQVIWQLSATNATYDGGTNELVIRTGELTKTSRNTAKVNKLINTAVEIRDDFPKLVITTEDNIVVLIGNIDTLVQVIIRQAAAISEYVMKWIGIKEKLGIGSITINGVKYSKMSPDIYKEFMKVIGLDYFTLIQEKSAKGAVSQEAIALIRKFRNQ